MKRLTILTLTTILALLLAACGSTTPTPNGQLPIQSEPAAAQQAPADSATPITQSVALDTSYENTLTQRLLLAFGTLKLAETNNAVTHGQAAEMVLLWQALQTMSQSGNSAVAETEALLDQIEGSFSPEQITAINALKLSQTDLQTWATENNVTLGTGSGEGGMGQGQGLSPDARATRQAANGKTGSVQGESGLSAVITTSVITYLQGIQ
jgi:hypothetical protein